LKKLVVYDIYKFCLYNGRKKVSFNNKLLFIIKKSQLWIFNKLKFEKVMFNVYGAENAKNKRNKNINICIYIWVFLN
jgi:hypothetical protein